MTELCFVESFIKTVAKPIVITSLICLSMTYIIHLFVPNTFIGLVCLVSLSIVLTCSGIYSLGLTSHEKEFVSKAVVKRIKKFVR